MLKKVLLGVVVFILIAAAMFGFQVKREIDRQVEETLNTITIDEIVLTSVPDGVYEGECDLTNVYVKARVTVKDQRMVAIELLEHRHGRGAKGEQIVDSILAEQSVLVDSISGATVSSLAIAKAVENTIEGASVQ